MNYTETVEYLFSQLPMYQRIGKSAYKSNLDTTIYLDNYFRSPHRNYATIHIAGTNGKGSVAHSIASILQAAGYRTGLYTSPHYLDFRERIKINGEMIDKNFVVEFTEKHTSFFKQLQPSFFELTAAMAFEYFAKKNVDIAVIEVGMGGRLDSTNIITPEISVITNIGYDHTQFLGNKLSDIATEKAGIIKENVPVVVGETKAKLKMIFSNKAQEKNAPIFFSDHSFAVKGFFSSGNQSISDINKYGNPILKNLIFGLSGNYQRFNIPIILQTIEILQKKLNISTENIKSGMANVVKNTGIMGRWQILSENPQIICDAGHNYDGVFNVVDQIKSLNYSKLYIILGFVNDKNLNQILKLFPDSAEYHFTKAKIPRAMNETELKQQAQAYNLQGYTHANIADAIKEVLSKIKKDEVLFIGGSTFIVSEAIEHFNN